MTTEYHLTSEKLEGAIIFRYRNALFDSVNFEHLKEPSDKIIDFVFTRIPLWEKDLATQMTTANSTLTKIDTTITFETFWKAYSKGITEHCGNKKQANEVWNDLETLDKQLAHEFLKKHLAYKKQTGENPLHAKTYLRQKAWTWQ